MDIAGRFVPVDTAGGFLEDFRRGGRLLSAYGALRHRVDGAVDYGIDSLNSHGGSELHQSVVDGSHVLVGPDLDLFASDNVACVEFMLEEECGHTSLFVAIDHGPVDRSRSAVTREQ